MSTPPPGAHHGERVAATFTAAVPGAIIPVPMRRLIAGIGLTIGYLTVRTLPLSVLTHSRMVGQ